MGNKTPTLQPPFSLHVEEAKALETVFINTILAYGERYFEYQDFNNLKEQLKQLNLTSFFQSGLISFSNTKKTELIAEDLIEFATTQYTADKKFLIDKIKEIEHLSSSLKSLQQEVYKNVLTTSGLKSLELRSALSQCSLSISALSNSLLGVTLDGVEGRKDQIYGGQAGSLIGIYFNLISTSPEYIDTNEDFSFFRLRDSEIPNPNLTHISSFIFCILKLFNFQTLTKDALRKRLDSLKKDFDKEMDEYESLDEPPSLPNVSSKAETLYTLNLPPLKISIYITPLGNDRSVSIYLDHHSGTGFCSVNLESIKAFKYISKGGELVTASEYNTTSPATQLKELRNLDLLIDCQWCQVTQSHLEHLIHIPLESREIFKLDLQKTVNAMKEKFLPNLGVKPKTTLSELLLTFLAKN